LLCGILSTPRAAVKRISKHHCPGARSVRQLLFRSGLFGSRRHAFTNQFVASAAVEGNVPQCPGCPAGQEMVCRHPSEARTYEDRANPASLHCGVHAKYRQIRGQRWYEPVQVLLDVGNDRIESCRAVCAKCCRRQLRCNLGRRIEMGESAAASRWPPRRARPLQRRPHRSSEQKAVPRRAAPSTLALSRCNGCTRAQVVGVASRISAAYSTTVGSATIR
jgi:hypothetical protein